MGFKARLTAALAAQTEKSRTQFEISRRNRTTRYKRMQNKFFMSVVDNNEKKLFRVIRDGFFIPGVDKPDCLSSLLCCQICRDSSPQMTRKVIKVMFGYDNNNQIPCVDVWENGVDSDEMVEFMMEPMFSEIHSFHASLVKSFAVFEALCQNHFVEFMNRYGQTATVKERCKKILESGNFNRTFRDTLTVYGFE